MVHETSHIYIYILDLPKVLYSLSLSCSKVLARDQTFQLICHLGPGVVRFLGSMLLFIQEGFPSSSSAQDLPFFWGSVQLPPDPYFSPLIHSIWKTKYIPFSAFPWNVARCFFWRVLFLLYVAVAVIMSDITIISLKADLLSSLFLNSITMISLMPVHSKDFKRSGSMEWVAICHQMNVSVHLSKP